MSHPRREMHPLVSADVALFSMVGGELRVLMVRRANKPQRGRWALPGAVLDVDRDDSLEDTARRALREKIRLASVEHLEQVETFSGLERDPRGWSVSALFCSLLPLDRTPAIAGHKTEAIEWRDPSRPGEGLAFDHATHIERALARLRDKVERHRLPLHLLPARFTLTQLQQTVQAIVGREVEKSAFRRRLRDDPALEAVPGEQLRGDHRPAQVYRAGRGFTF